VSLLDRVLDRLFRLPERRQFIQQVATWRSSIVALSADTARDEAGRLLTNVARFRIGTAPVNAAPLPVAFGPGLCEFLDRYALVEERYGDGRFGRSFIAPSELLPGAWRVGVDAEFAELVAHPDADAVLYVPGENPDGDPPTWWPSIYHYVLMNATIRQEYEPPPPPVSDTSPSRPAS
jgi:hypothetical protein